jgi:hypothetical protein
MGSSALWRTTTDVNQLPEQSYLGKNARLPVRPAENAKEYTAAGIAPVSHPLLVLA